MHKPHSRMICALLALILTFSLLPVTARAAEASGQCGPDAYWRFADGVLTIYGSGPMDNFVDAYGGVHIPWGDAGIDGEYVDIDAVIIEPGITSIGDYAFNSIWFPSISIPNTVTYIGDSAFTENRKLINIAIPESVTYIGQDAFNTCPVLSTVIINANITTLEDRTFCGCTNLGNVKLPGTLTTIGTSCFQSNKGLASLVIPEGVTTIEDWAFRDCTILASVSLPSTLESIGELAFAGTYSLKEIVIPENVRKIEPFVFADTLFNENSFLETVIFQGNAPEIDSYAFHNLSFTAYYPQNKNWPESIFRDHDHITWIPYGDTVADNKCGDNLTWALENGVLTITGTGAMTDFDGVSVPWALHKNEIHTVNLDARVTHIGNNAFNGCIKLTNIPMPAALTTIGDNAFNGCSAMTELSIPGTVTAIGDSAFAGCTALTTLSLPNSVTSIGSFAFASCTELAGITLPNNLHTMGTAAFSRCSSLRSIAIPGSLTAIPYQAFNRCYALESIAIGEGVTDIGEYAFTTAQALHTLSLPQSLRTIQFSAFGGCNNLTNVTIPANITSISEDAFDECYNLREITFQGDAPEMLGAFEPTIQATAYYPANRNWPESVRHQHAYLTWVPYGEAAPNLSPLTGSWVTRISLSAADLGVDAPDATLQATTYFENDGTCQIKWDPVDLTALQMFFHNMFVNSYYAMAYGAGITDLAEMERICMEQNGMSVSDYMSTIVTRQAIWSAFVPEDASGTYSLNADQTAIYTDMPFMGVPSDPSIANSFVIGDNTLYLNAASYGKPDYTFVYSRIVN